MAEAPVPDGAGAHANGPGNDAVQAGGRDGAPAPRSAKNYDQYYDNLDDILRQRYTRLYDRYRIGDPQVLQPG